MTPLDREVPLFDADATAANVTERSTDGAELLDEVRRALTRYVVLPSAEATDAVVLWIATTHGQTALEHAPRLSITAPEKRCGKSRLLDIVEATCSRPLVTVNATVAAIFRSIGDDPPTLLIDEADTIFGPKTADQNEDLRALLNAGHQRGRPTLRCSGPNQDVKAFPTFAMAALAGIGGLPDTITDRAISIPMRRRAPGESVQPYRRRRDEEPLKALGLRVHMWVSDRLEDLRMAEPDMPLEDRAADTWEPLIAVADIAGGDWPARARIAATRLNGVAEESDATAKMSTKLLSDLRDVFGDETSMHGETILDRLHKIEDGPWSDYFGRPFNSRDLAKLLRPYGAAPEDVKIAGVNRKGYKRESLWDAWQRYLPPVDHSATSATWATPQVTSVAHESEVADGSATSETIATSLSRQVAQVAQVADASALPIEWPPNSQPDLFGEPESADDLEYGRY